MSKHDILHKHDHLDYSLQKEKNIKIAIFVNFFFAMLEFFVGFLSNSLAVLSDALHDLTDTIALTLSYFLEKKASEKPNDTRLSFGYKRLSIFASLIAAIILIAGSLIILAKAIERLFKPEFVVIEYVFAISVLGIFVNAYAFFKLHKGKSITEKVLSWHMLEDFFGWLTIFAGTIIMYITKLYIIDPIITIAFTLFILFGVARHLKEIATILMEGVPSHIDVESVRKRLLSIEGVKDVHDIHIWSLEGQIDIFSGHIVIEQNKLKDYEKIKAKAKKLLNDMHIEHTTIEIETENQCYDKGCCLFMPENSKK